MTTSTKTTSKVQTIKSAKAKQAGVVLNKYYNNTNQNLWTTSIKVSPNDTIMLTNEEASKYVGLTLV